MHSDYNLESNDTDCFPLNVLMMNQAEEFHQKVQKWVSNLHRYQTDRGLV